MMKNTLKDLLDKNTIKKLLNENNNKIVSSKKDKNQIKHTNWSCVHCMDGYLLLYPPFNGCQPKKIMDSRCRKNMNLCIAKYKNKLPKLTWELCGNKATIKDKKKIVEYILKIKREDKALWQKSLEGTAFVTYGRFAYNEIDTSIFSTAYELQWDDVRFYNRYFIFEPKLNEKELKNKTLSLRVNDYRCRKDFNYFTDYFQKRLPKITYHITKDFQIELNSKPLFDSVFTNLVKRVDDLSAEIKVKHPIKRIGGIKLSFFSAMSKAQILKPEDFERYKSKFISFLVTHQVNECNIVPATENISHIGSNSEETVFIFTAKSHDAECLFIVIENVNPDRSTMVFKVETEKYMKALHTIFDYIQSDIINKRSAVRDKDIIDFGDAGVVDYYTLNHDSETYWMNYLKMRFK